MSTTITGMLPAQLTTDTGWSVEQILGRVISASQVGGANPTTVEATFSTLNVKTLNTPYTVPLRRWRRAVAKVRTGTGRGRLVFIGDSTTMGAGAGTSTGQLGDAFTKSLPARLAPLLNSYYVPTSFESIWGSQNANALINYATYDPRVAFGTGWAMSGGGTLGAQFIRYTSGTPSTFAFTPAASFDTLTIFYYRASSQGSFTVDVDGGASLGTVNTSGAISFQSVSYTVAAGTHTININAQNNGSLFIAGIFVSTAAIPAIDVILGAWYGAKAQTFAGGGDFGPLTALRAIAPDCTVVNATINDSNAGTPLTAYAEALQLIIAAAQESGDVILMCGPPSNTVAATNGTLDKYVDVLYALAAVNKCAVMDTKARWISYATTNPFLPYADGLHPGNTGYSDIAQGLFQILSSQ